MANEKLISSLSTIERALGKIEGVAFVLEEQKDHFCSYGERKDND